MEITEFRLYLGAGYLGSVLTEEEAKAEVIKLTKKHPAYSYVGLRYHYQKYTREPRTEYEKETGLPEWSKE